MKKVIMFYLMAAVVLCGCSKAEEKTIGPYLYYVNAEQTELVEEPYEITQDTPEKAVAEMLKSLNKTEKKMKYRSPFPKKVKVKEYQINKGVLELYFDDAYAKMKNVEEVLLRSSLVRSLVQIEGVDSVAFFVDGKPLTNQSGTTLGLMRAEDFVQNTGSAINSYQETAIKLYFANAGGVRLVQVTDNVRHNSNVPIEKLIIEELIKGPSGTTVKATIPSGTKLLGVSVKDGTCYVNFDDGLQQPIEGVKPETTVYSVVNSIVDSGVAGHVQILIRGETSAKFLGTVSLEKPFSHNLDIIEDESEE